MQKWKKQDKCLKCYVGGIKFNHLGLTEWDVLQFKTLSFVFFFAKAREDSDPSKCYLFGLLYCVVVLLRGKKIPANYIKV